MRWEQSATKENPGIWLTHDTWVKGHCVYLWRDGEEVFYVGRGIKNRPWAYHKRTPAEIRRRQAGSRFSVEVLKEGLTKQESVQLELEMISRYTPDCNMFCPFVVRQWTHLHT